MIQEQYANALTSAVGIFFVEERTKVKGKEWGEQGWFVQEELIVRETNYKRFLVERSADQETMWRSLKLSIVHHDKQHT